MAHLVSLKHTNEIIRNNEAQLSLTNAQSQQVQGTNQSIETVMNWKIEDPRLIEEQLRQQFLTKTKTRRTPTSDRVSPRVPLATADMGVSIDLFMPMNNFIHLNPYPCACPLTLSLFLKQFNFQEFYQDEPMDQVSVPIYTYDPTTGSTQV